MRQASSQELPSCLGVTVTLSGSELPALDGRVVTLFHGCPLGEKVGKQRKGIRVNLAQLSRPTPLDRWHALAGLHSGEAHKCLTVSFLPVGAAGSPVAPGRNRGGGEGWGLEEDDGRYLS